MLGATIAHYLSKKRIECAVATSRLKSTVCTCRHTMNLDVQRTLCTVSRTHVQSTLCTYRHSLNLD